MRAGDQGRQLGGMQWRALTREWSGACQTEVCREMERWNGRLRRASGASCPDHDREVGRKEAMKRLTDDH